jgi:hypothetical protein
MTSGDKPLPQALAPGAQERVVAILTRHFANDWLNEAELEARLQRVYAATTSSELDAVISDLPAAPAAQASPVPAARATITALFSGEERRIVSLVPRELRVRARLGYVELDLTGAEFEPGLTTIEVRAVMGYVQIRFPPGVRVENEGHALFGFFALKGGGSPEGATGGERVVRVTGRALFGFAECFAPRA